MQRPIFPLALVFMFVGLFAGLLAGQVAADEPASFDVRLQAAIASPDRPDKDKARDANRLPRETLLFFELDSNQRVLELLPGAGWYTRLLASTLDGTGQLYLAFAQQMPKKLAESKLLSNVEILEVDAPFEPTEHGGIFQVGAFELPVKKLDAVLTFRNMHNLTPEARANLNAAVFKALRPGGVYGVIDHTRRHNEADTAENWRRLDPVLMIQEIQAAGFVFEDASELHYRPADPLEKEVGHESVTGRTDRFTLKFRKP